MLERASTCLESGGRQLLRAPKPPLPTRRRLHSAFWHHAASDLSLPLWWATSSVLNTSSGDYGRSAANTTTTTTTTTTTATAHIGLLDGLLLDFLYPSKTLALIKRLSVHVPDTSVARRRQQTNPRARQYSTVPERQIHPEELSPAEPLQAQATADMKILLVGSTPRAELDKLLATRKPETQELAWQIYLTIPSDEHATTNHRLQKDILEFMVQDTENMIASRVLQVFGELPPMKRRASSFRAAVLAYIKLQMVGPAMQLLEDVDPNRSFDMRELGIGSILAYTVRHEQWDLSFRVFQLFLRHTPKILGKSTRVAMRHGNSLPEIWSELQYSSLLPEHLQSFFFHVKEYRQEIKSLPERELALSCFVMTFVPRVISHIINTRKPDEEYIWHWFLELFVDLEDLDLPTSACYEYAIKEMLELPRYKKYSNERKIWLKLYNDYREKYLQNEDVKDAKPSEHVIRKLIVNHGPHASLERIEEFVQDLRNFYPDRPLRPGLLKYLLFAYADRGADQRVFDYFEELQRNWKKEIDLKVLSALLHVYARRADIDQTIAQFRRIQDEFGLVPDTACWNIVLNAHVRADDMDGALECFNRCLDQGIVPDESTFGPLMDFCSQRGDVEAFEALFSKGKQLGLALDTNPHARTGYVRVILNAGDPDGAFAVAQGMVKSWQAGTLPEPPTVAWTAVIEHYAVNGDLTLARACYRQMVEHKIPITSWTLAALMRGLIEVKQTNAAYKMLRVTMPKEHYRVYALHYAICMSGFLREGQVHLALQTYERMIERNVPQTSSSQQAAIRTLGAVDLAKLDKRGAKHPNYRLLTVEAALENMLTTNTGPDFANRELSHTRYLDTKNPMAVPQMHYGLLASLYTSRHAFRIASKLLKKAEEAAPESGKYYTPLTLLNATMELHFKRRNYAEVEVAWQKARETADHLTKTLHQASSPDSHIEDPATSLTDPEVRERYQESRISTNRRYILARSARIYLRSLLAQPSADMLDLAQRTIRNLLVHGYAIDNFTWNEFIQHLAQRGRLTDAFTTCETYLMPAFPGWRKLSPTYIRNEQPGVQLMDIRHFELRKHAVMPRYKTLVILAQVFGNVKRDESNGIGYDKDMGMWMTEALETAAPLTCRAIESMPRTNDRLQWKYVHGGE
ncbi:hypothetical protein ACN47E_008421 [Coniothyrium glycines]